jgi:hypothetical protein
MRKKIVMPKKTLKNRRGAATLSSVKEEMAKPRMARSVRDGSRSRPDSKQRHDTVFQGRR